MSRRNKRKVNTIGKSAVFFANNAQNKGNVCTTGDGACLKTTPERRDAGNADRQR